MRTGTSMSGIINVNKQRENKGIKPIKCNCRTCLYFDGKMCKFNKSTQNRKYCIKYQYSNPSLMKPQKKKPKSKEEINQIYEKIIKQTTFEKLSHFFGIKISLNSLTERYKYYDKGYSMKIRTKEPLTVVLRNEKSRKKFYYEIIE